MTILAVSAVASVSAQAADSAAQPIDHTPWQTATRQAMQQAGSDQSSVYHYYLMAGELALARQDSVAAARQYAKALALKPSGALAARTTRIALAADQPALAYPAARQWAHDRPRDPDAQRAALRLAFMADDAAEVAQVAPHLVATAESQRAGYELVAALLSDRPAHADTALAAAKGLATATDAPPEAGYVLAATAYGYNRLDLADQTIGHVTQAAPDWAQACMLAAAIDVRQGRFSAARQAVAGLSGSAAERARYHVALARYLLQAGKSDSGAKEFHAALDLAPHDADARFGLGLIALADNDNPAARKAFSQVVDDPDHGSDAAFYMGVLAERAKNNDQARRWYAKVNDGGHVVDAGMRRAYLLSQAGDIDKALAALDTLAEQAPARGADIAAARGELLLEAGQAKRALALYNSALADMPQESGLLYGRAMVYERLGRIDAAESDLKQVLAQDSDDAQALNALGYMLTNHAKDYDQAADYIRRALAQMPNNPAIQDSMGWVLFKQGKYPAARKALEKAYQGSDDAEIAAHLGAVRWAEGQHDAARAIWQKARQAHPKNDTLEQMIKEHGQ